MSIRRKLRAQTRSTHHSPRVSVSSKPKQSVRHSLHLDPGALSLDRSLNNSQATDRSYQSPRILNSKRGYHRRSITNHINRSMKQGSKDTKSYLDASIKSASFQVKGKKVSTSVKAK